MARWMSTKGARNIVLTSRSASLNERVQALADELSQHGTKLVVQACDVCDIASVTKLLVQDLSSLPPVRGIVHGAMVLKVSFLMILFNRIRLTFATGHALRADGY